MKLPALWIKISINGTEMWFAAPDVSRKHNIQLV